MPEEEWRQIRGYEGFYEVSNMGRVRSVDRIFHPGRVLKSIINMYGYPTVGLSAGRLKFFKVHRLVAQAFIPNPGNKPQVNHKNGIKTDDMADNLEWNTKSENIRHAFATNLIAPQSGEKCGASKLNERQARLVKHLKNIKPKMTYVEIGALFGIGKWAVWAVQSGRNWKHIII